MFVFIKGQEGVSQKTGKNYQVLTLAQHVKVADKVKVKISEFFPANPVKLNEFDFGDICECVFSQPEFAGDFPKLQSVKLVGGSPYPSILERYMQRQDEE